MADYYFAYCTCGGMLGSVNPIPNGKKCSRCEANAAGMSLPSGALSATAVHAPIHRSMYLRNCSTGCGAAFSSFKGVPVSWTCPECLPVDGDVAKAVQPSRRDLAADVYARIIDWGANFRNDAKRYREWSDLVVAMKREKNGEK